MPVRKYSSLSFVSRNADKHREYCALLGLADLTMSRIRVTEPQSLNLHWVVEQKLEIVSAQLPKQPFFLEHTGLIIDAWKGLPGGLTQTFLDTVGNEGLCRMMTAFHGDERAARAHVVIGFHDPDLGSRMFEGEVAGRIASSPRGTNNFGWDPIFIPAGDTRTYGEMSLEEKDLTSMRRRAVERFAEFLGQHFQL